MNFETDAEEKTLVQLSWDSFHISRCAFEDVLEIEPELWFLK